MARGDQLSRQWKIIQQLINSRSGKSVTDLSDELGCHQRTVYRDLDALQAAGFPIYAETVSGKKYWTLLDAARQHVPIPFSLTELMALYFSRDVLKVLHHTAFHDSLDGLFEKVKMTLPGEYVKFLEQFQNSVGVAHKPYKTVPDLESNIRKINTAMAKKKKIAIEYFTMRREKSTQRTVSPYKVWFSEDTFYLIGICHLRRDWRVFALDRITALEETDEAFADPENMNIEEQLKSSFGVFLGENQVVTIWFSAEIAGYIREKTWHASQKIHENQDGSIIFKVEVAGIQEIKFWILRWGAKARVLAPKMLKDEIRDEAEAMVDVYTD